MVGVQPYDYVVADVAGVERLGKDGLIVTLTSPDTLPVRLYFSTWQTDKLLHQWRDVLALARDDASFETVLRFIEDASEL